MSFCEGSVPMPQQKIFRIIVHHMNQEAMCRGKLPQPLRIFFLPRKKFKSEKQRNYSSQEIEVKKTYV